LVDAGNEKELIEVTKKIIQPTKIKALDDVFEKSSINGKVGGVIGDVTDNDEYNATKADDVKIVATVVESPENVTLSIDNDGKLSVGENTPEGDYTAKYQICEKTRSDNCSQATVKFIVKNINNIEIVTKHGDEDINASYQFFSLNDNGEAGEKLNITCQSDVEKPCTIQLNEGKYVILSISGDQRMDTFVTVKKKYVTSRDEVQKIEISMDQ
jgi:hypothetical protein